MDLFPRNRARSPFTYRFVLLSDLPLISAGPRHFQFPSEALRSQLEALTLLVRPASLRTSESLCQKCDASPADHVSGVPRRNFLKLAAAVATGLAISRYAVAAEKTGEALRYNTNRGGMKNSSKLHGLGGCSACVADSFH
jgi:hypothetical protein